MNKDEKNRLDENMTKVEEVMAIIEQLRDDEQEAFDEMSEKQQEGPKGQALQEIIDKLNEVHEGLETAVSNGRELVGH